MASLPIVCAWCDRVRTASGRWEQSDGQVPSPSEATHGICPECLAEAQHAARVEAGADPLSRAGARP